MTVDADLRPEWFSVLQATWLAGAYCLCECDTHKYVGSPSVGCKTDHFRVAEGRWTVSSDAALGVICFLWSQRLFL